MADSERSRHFQLLGVLVLHMHMMGLMHMMMLMLVTILVLKQQTAGGGRKRKRREVVMENLVAELRTMTSAMESLKEDLKVVADFFAKQREIEEMGMAFFAEIMKFEDLSKEEMLRAGESISKDKSKVAFFLSLPQEFKRTFIMKQLGVVPKPEN